MGKPKGGSKNSEVPDGNNNANTRSGSRAAKEGQPGPKKKSGDGEKGNKEADTTGDSVEREGMRTRAGNSSKRPGVIDAPRPNRSKAELAAIRLEAEKVAEEAEEEERQAKVKAAAKQARLKALEAAILEEEDFRRRNADHPPPAKSRPKPRPKPADDGSTDLMDIDNIQTDRQQRGLGFKRGCDSESNASNTKRAKITSDAGPRVDKTMEDTPMGESIEEEDDHESNHDVEYVESDATPSEFEPEEETDEEVHPSDGGESQSDGEREENSEEDDVLLLSPSSKGKSKGGVKGTSNGEGEGNGTGNGKGKGGKGKGKDTSDNVNVKGKGKGTKGKGTQAKRASKALLAKKLRPQPGNLVDGWPGYIHPTTVETQTPSATAQDSGVVHLNRRARSIASSAPDNSTLTTSRAQSIASSAVDESNAEGVVVRHGGLGDENDETGGEDPSTASTLRSKTTANVCGRVVRGGAAAKVKVTRTKEPKGPRVRLNRASLPSDDTETFRTVIHPFLLINIGALTYSGDGPVDMWAKPSPDDMLALWDEYATTPSEECSDVIVSCMTTGINNWRTSMAKAGIEAVEWGWKCENCVTIEQRNDYVRDQIGGGDSAQDPMRKFMWKFWNKNNENERFNFCESELVAFVLGNHLHLLEPLGDADTVLLHCLESPPVNALLFSLISIYRALLFCVGGVFHKPGSVNDSAFSEDNWGSHRMGGKWILEIYEVIQAAEDDFDWPAVLHAAEVYRNMRGKRKMRSGNQAAAALPVEPAPPVKKVKMRRKPSPKFDDDAATTHAAETVASTSTATATATSSESSATTKPVSAVGAA